MSGEREFFDRYARGTQGTTYNQSTTQATGGYTSNVTYSSSQRIAGSSTSDNAQNTRNFEAHRSELEGERSALLKYASDLNENVIVTGSTDYSKLSTLRSAILELKNGYFSQTSGFSIKGEKRD